MTHTDRRRRPRWWRIALVVILALLVVLGAVALAGWLVLRSVAPGDDPVKARAEVQRAYDKRWPGRVKVDSCIYYEDPEGSIFDQYDCRISLRCPRAIRFGVPRADALGRSNFDVSLPEGTGPRQLFGCGSDSGGNRRLTDGSLYGKVIAANVARRRLKFAPACRLHDSGRWLSTSRVPVTVAVAPHADLALYDWPNGNALSGRSQSADWKQLDELTAHGRLQAVPAG